MGGLMPTVPIQLGQAWLWAASGRMGRIKCRGMEEVLWEVFIDVPVGGPSAASVEFKWQARMPNTAKGEDDTNETWVDIDPARFPNLFPDGGWGGVLADQTLAAPIYVARRSLMQADALALYATVAFTSGTTPAFPITAHATVRRPR